MIPTSRTAGGLASALAGSAAAVAAFLAPVAFTNIVVAAPLPQAQARATQLQARVMAQARLVHKLTVRYQQAAGVAMLLSQEVAGARKSVADLRHRLSSTEAMLRQEALQSYAGGLLPTASAGVSAGAAQTAAGTAYLQVTVGDITDTLDQFRSQQSQLSAALAALGEQLRNATAAERRAALAQRRALAQASSLQRLLDRTRRQVAALEAEEKLAAEQRLVAEQKLVAQASLAARAKLAAEARLAVQRRSATVGPPVGNGVVAALSEQLSLSPYGARAATKLTVTGTAALSTGLRRKAAGTATGAAPTPAAPDHTGGVWLSLRECESGDNYQANTGNGFYGAYQFSESTWLGLGFQSRPDLEPYWLQDQAAQRLELSSGWGQWPACSALLGL